MTRVLCLGSKRDSMLMWAHYAQKHEGGVIALTTPTGSDSFLNLALPVRYTSILPVVLEPAEWAQFLVGLETPNFGERVRDVYLHKDSEWEYEEEYRCFFILPEPHDQDCKDPLPVPLREEVSGIYFGVRMSDADKASVQRFAEAKGLRVPYFQARLAEDRFGVTFDSLS
ncbi:MAG: DUF2971 domain-containing protein, partial [Planctomycetota bacterium]